MKIEYMRNMQFGYMRLEATEPLTKTEEAMLTHNVIEGLLPVCWQKENNRYLLRYDITGKLALDSVLEQTMADEKLLRHLLVGIYVTIKQLEKYLLPQESLFLNPEAIFYDAKTETMHFCFFPEGGETLQMQLVKLMEYVLAKTDHKNIVAVQMVYGVYEEVQKPSFCVEDLQTYLKEKSISPDREIISIEEVGAEKELCEQEERTTKEKFGWVKGKVEWKEMIMAWIKGKIKNFPKKKLTESAVIYDVYDVESAALEGATTVLGGMSDRIEGVLQYEGTNFLPDIRIDKLPFLIGSATDADGIITHPNISRKHARVTCRDGVYFIEDLNSTNGTRVNGGLLNYKTKVSIRRGTGIHFANEPYRFM